MYADDTSLCFQSKDLSRVNEALNEDLSRLDAWLVSNKLSLNVAKTKSMLVSTKAKRKTHREVQPQALVASYSSGAY